MQLDLIDGEEVAKDQIFAAALKGLRSSLQPGDPPHILGHFESFVFRFSVSIDPRG
jgi:hypothetical protein